MKNPDIQPAMQDIAYREELAVTLHDMLDAAGVTEEAWLMQSRPTELKPMGIQDFRLFYRALLSGDPPQHLGRIKAVLKALHATPQQIITVNRLWMLSVLEHNGITEEEAENEEIENLKMRCKTPNDKMLLHTALSEKTKFTEARAALALAQDGKLAVYAKNGDTEFEPGSAERAAIYSYRLAHELPLHHPGDSKLEHAEGTGQEREPIRMFRRKI